MNIESVTSPLSRHEILRTSSSTAALQTMSRYGATRIAPLEGKRFFFKVDAFDLDSVTLSHGYHGDGTISEYGTSDHFWQAFVVSGTSRQRVGGSEISLGPKNWSALFEPGSMLNSVSDPQYQQLTARIRCSSVMKLLSSWLGHGVKDVEIEARAPCTSPMLESFRRVVFNLASELDTNATEYIAPVLQELEQAVVISFLLSHSHNHSRHLLEEPAAPSQSQLSLIEDHIAANWHRSIDIAELAALSNVSARSIFRHFRERRGCSPAQFIKSIRLQHTHRVFSAADDRTSVVATALSAGFNSLGHFARSYRAAYGELPSETISRALGRTRSGGVPLRNVRTITDFAGSPNAANVNRKTSTHR